MKERIVCEKIKRPFGMHPDYGVDILENSLIYTRKVEQVPENFEELKELCKQTGHYAIDINNGGGLFYNDSIYVFNLTFKDNGEIDDNENNTVAENRTPAQMWQIIKSLVEE